MTTLPADQTAPIRLPAPPPRLGPQAHPASVLDVLCPPGSLMPSALDIDIARLPPAPLPRHGSPQPLPRAIGPATDDAADRRVERLRALAVTAAAAALVAVSAGALRLAL